MITSGYNFFTGKLTKILLKHRLDSRGEFDVTCCKTVFLRHLFSQDKESWWFGIYFVFANPYIVRLFI